MTTINFSTLTNGATISFDPVVDVLNFNNPEIHAASVQLGYAADFTAITLTAGGKTVHLTATVSLGQLSAGNITFDDGSQLLIGDHLSAVTNDDFANFLATAAKDDQLLGLGGNDRLFARYGNDRLDGGLGVDIMIGGLGNDTYIVDDAGDVVDETHFSAPVRVSTNAIGEEGDSDSFEARFSEQGRFMIFASKSSNLVAGDTNGYYTDIFFKDLQTGAIQLVSTDVNGNQGNNVSGNASFSADRRFVVFESWSTNLVAGDTMWGPDILLKDLQTGLIQRVSSNTSGVEGNGWSFNASFSSDGRYVLFDSDASDLIAGDTNGLTDFFVRDLQTGSLQRLSTDADGVQGNNLSERASFSVDGRYVVFESWASNLVAGDTNNTSDIFVKDLQAGAIRQVSTNALGEGGNDMSIDGSFSADGRYVVFMSLASNLVAGDTNNIYDVFVKDLQTGAIQLVSTDAVGIQGNGGSSDASLSADGRYVVFVSEASNLVAGDTNKRSDIFVKDLQTGAIQLVSTNANAVQGNHLGSFAPSFSTDSRYVAFASWASNLVAGDTNNSSDIFTVLNPFLVNGGIDTVQASVSYTLSANVENLTLLGTANINATGNGLDNTLTANSGNNILKGAGGSDTASYAAASSGVSVNLSLTGPQATGQGVDTLISIENLLGSDYDDTLIGNSGANRLNGGQGLDLLIGLAGDDTYVVGTAAAQIIEDEDGGRDTVLATVSLKLAANVEVLTLTGSANLAGVGNGRANIITGNSGSNLLNGGVGIDTVSYANATEAVKANLANKVATGFGTDMLIGFENLVGSRYDDRLFGNSGNNVVRGGGGGDTLIGGSGHDTLIGGADNDILTGGHGRDTFFFNHRPDAATNLDTIVDFDPASDTIRLSNTGDGLFTALSAGTLAAGAFNSGAGMTTATQADDRIIYNTSTGALYYDADGTEAQSAIQIAALGITTHPSLTSTDFMVA